MPRVRPLIRTDPREIAVRKEIGGILMMLGDNKSKLAELSGIKYGTLMSRIGSGYGDIGRMTLREYWAIQDAVKGGG